MKNTIKTLTVTALAAVMAFTVSCETLSGILGGGGGEGTASQPAQRQQAQAAQASTAHPAVYLGAWVRLDNESMIIILMPDGTGKDLDDYTTFVWSVEGDKFKWDDTEFTVTLNGNDLGFSRGRSRFTFIRVPADKVAQYEKDFEDGAKIMAVKLAWNPGPNQPSPAGVWVFVDKEGKLVARYTYNANGTGQLYITATNQTQNFRWKTSGNKLTYTYPDGDSNYIYSVEGNTLMCQPVSDFGNSTMVRFIDIWTRQ